MVFRSADGNSKNGNKESYIEIDNLECNSKERVLSMHKILERNNKLEINLSEYSNSIYLLRVSDLEQNLRNTYKIQKIQ